jgi:protein-tyrosine phosphatase
LRLVADTIETSRAGGPLLVCCALGYGRSAASVAAWLLISGRTQDVEAAIGEIRRVRPRAVMNDKTRAAIAAAGATR